MLVCGSNCFELDFIEERTETETLGMMVKDGMILGDGEEGEISDTASVEEISEEAFCKQEATVESKPKEEGRVWTMQDLYKYSINRGYSSGLYNLAWAQAVQNKPLNNILVMDVDNDENSKSSGASSVNSKNLGKEVDRVVIDGSEDEVDALIIDVEKEEGELEEGEIDLDSEMVERECDDVKEGVLEGNDLNEIDLDGRVNCIQEALACIKVFDAEKSFEEVCSKLLMSLESMLDAVPHINSAKKDALVGLSFTAIQVVSSVFRSMNHEQKEQHKGIYSRLLSIVKNKNLCLFSSDQTTEIEAGMSSGDVLLSTRHCDREKMIQVIDGMNKGPDHLAKNELPIHSIGVNSLVPNSSTESLKPGSSSSKGRGILLPLLDLHKDHDIDSLPSPTREAPSYFPVKRAFAAGNGLVKPEWTTSKVACETENSARRLYETDALKSVSTYQQKFGRSSFFSYDELPSPTPSEDGDVGDRNVSGEVSSSSHPFNLSTGKRETREKVIVSSSPSLDSFNGQGLLPARYVAPESSGSNPTRKSSGRSRDPRLRFANPDTAVLDLNQQPLPIVHNALKVDTTILSSRKQKKTVEPISDGPALKRQRNELEISGITKDVKIMSGSGGLLEDNSKIWSQFMNRNQHLEDNSTDPRKIDNGVTCTRTMSVKPAIFNGNEPLPVINNTMMPALPQLLKDIAVNPTMLLNILKMGQQQRLAAESLHKSADPAENMMQSSSSNTILGRGSLGNISSGPALDHLHKPAGPLQVPSQIAPVDESRKIRMKPRDPRRALHGNLPQKNGSLVPKQSKIGGLPTLNTTEGNDNTNFQKVESEAETIPVTPLSGGAPDLTQQFTKNLRNIAEIVSKSQTTSSPPVVSQNFFSQQIQTKPEKVDVKMKPTVSNAEELRHAIGSSPEVGAACKSQNKWRDVAHLFEKYDDQQKAAIHQERARRIEEQKKMFAARKLCLVLDLDHTLLNSAKFVEVDPVHDEILRKKEEQDREKPQRHLFRFPHMGMWTKLRPGVWNFLEKASKLFELHLYTMGNKIYATEMAKVLDPKGVLFAGRVISKGDDGDSCDTDERVPKTKDLEGVLGMESAVVIIDDSVRVWPHHKLNLIVVERYTFFPCSRRQFGLLGPSLLEIDHDERPEDGTLASSLAVIERIHQIFFSHLSLDEVDVRNILASEQQKILAGCRIVFSRIFPVGEASPHLHPLWQTAEQFGAVCTNQLDEHVTHVVANSLGTDKVNWALSTGKFVVHPGWVEASALLYRRANEHDFATKP